jgi:hypothetical protein
MRMRRRGRKRDQRRKGEGGGREEERRVPLESDFCGEVLGEFSLEVSERHAVLWAFGSGEARDDR